MLELTSIQNWITVALIVGLFVLKGFALVDCVGRPANQFSYLETLSKQGWLIILVLAVLGHIISPYPIAILNLLGTVAAGVYLAQVRGSR